MSDRLQDLRNEAEAIGELDETRLTPVADREPYVILRPTDTDALLDGAASDPEQNLPYWAEIWPSGIALAEAVAAASETVRGQRVFELGSGLGVTAVAALRAGANLIAADYSPESLTFCRYNTVRNAGREPETLRLNWRRPGIRGRPRGGRALRNPGHCAAPDAVRTDRRAGGPPLVGGARASARRPLPRRGVCRRLVRRDRHVRRTLAGSQGRGSRRRRASSAAGSG